LTDFVLFADRPEPELPESQALGDKLVDALGALRGEG
jgi:hypothetical protein